MNTITCQKLRMFLQTGIPTLGEETFLPWDSEMAGYFEKNVAQGMSGKVKPGGHCDLGQCAPLSS